MNSVRWLCLLAFVLPSLSFAQEDLYGQMKGRLDAGSLPLVNLVVDVASVNTTDYVQAEMEIADYQRRTDPESETVRFRCKLRYRGASSTGYHKKSFAVKLYDEAGEDLDANLFGIRKENSWILDAMAIDRIRMRNRVCFDVWNEMSRTPYETSYGQRNGTEGLFVEVFLNGTYHGLYCLTDKIDRKLLGLKKVKAEGDEVNVRGLLYKGEVWNNYTDIYLRSYRTAPTDTDKWNAWELQYPDDYPGIDTWQPLMDLIDYCSARTSDKDFVSSYAEHFYKENLAEYLLHALALHVEDNLYKNTFLSVVDITKGHRFMLTPWDMDMSLGGNWDGKHNETLATINAYNSRAPFNRLVGRNVDGFVDRLTELWEAYYATLFHPDSIAERLDRYANMFEASGAWEREYNKWNMDPVPLRASVEEETDYVKHWYVKNHESLCSQFGTVPVYTAIDEARESVPGAAVYTIDGRKVNQSDPHRLPKGIYIIEGRKIIVR